MNKVTKEGLPLSLLNTPNHHRDIIDSKWPFLLINTYDIEYSSNLVDTDKLTKFFIRSKILMDFTNKDTLAIPLIKSRRQTFPGIILGRSNNCDVVLDKKDISRRHLAFVQKDSDWFIVDLASKNGTYIEGQKLIPYLKKKMTSQNIITVGSQPQLDIAFLSTVDLSTLLTQITLDENC